KTSFGYELYAGAEEYFTEKVVKNPEQLDKNIAEMKSWMSEEELSWEELYEELLPKLGVREEKRQKVGEMFLYNYYPQAKWTTGDAFNISIGQGENSYTPLQMANYIATLGNDGVHNKVSLVKTVADQGAKEKEAGKKIDISDDKYLDYIIEGMVGVANGSESTVSTIFGNMEQKVAAKTGTAERAGKVNPPSEVEYVKSNLGSIAPSLSWGDIETEMKRLMKEYPKIYTSEDTAVRRAVQNVSGGTVTSAQIDANKGEYENFAWVVAMAPADDPKIAVCAMVPQGSTAANAAPIVKEVLGKYFDTKEEYTDFTITNVVE
ncbi:MAG: penicillin-binding transpeptidase domain-containing protein, partial [Anaerovoracaceae bacterium]